MYIFRITVLFLIPIPPTQVLNILEPSDDMTGVMTVAMTGVMVMFANNISY